MKRILIIFSLISLCICSLAQMYPFDSIPGNLRKNADAVIRTAQCTYTVSKPGNAVMKIKEAISILNEDGDYLRYLAVPYNKYSKVNYIRGYVYDMNGELMKSMNYSDINDMSVMSGNFYSDDRMKVLRFPVNRYPFTIECEYEVEYSSILSYPTWSFQESRHVSVEKSGIQFVLPAGMNLRYYGRSLKNNVDSALIDGKKIYTWQETDIPAISLVRSLSTSFMPVLYTAPLDFEYAGNKGSMASWKTFGDWVYSINKDRDKLPENEINQVNSIVSKYRNDREKIRAIYEYMQSKTRYVSVQIGIGGLQTAEAASVSENGFGDCKALSNYTLALLKAAGIKSFLALVNAGSYEEDINTKFVDDQFNHVILCVPLQADTVWLECTSQSSPFNYLGSFTCGRHALLLTPEGGKLVRTPDYRKEQNIKRTTGTFLFNTAGTSSARIRKSYSGCYFGDFSSSFALQSEDEMKKALYESMEYPDCTVTSTGYTEQKTENPVAEFQYQISIRGFGTSNGKELLFAPSISKMDFFPKDTILIRVPVSDIKIDSLTYWMPPNYTIGSMPESISLKSKFGSYNYSIKTEGEKIIFYRKMEFEKGPIAKKDYYDFRNFVNSIARADRGIIILNRPAN